MSLRRTLTCAVVLSLTVPAVAAARPHPWATVNVCDTADQPDTVGVRGSMPGGTGTQLYLRIQLQFERPDGTWALLGASGDSGFVHAGSSKARTRQAGRSFQVRHPDAGDVYTLRGLVTFEWRRGSLVVRRAIRHTTGGHKPTAGSDPDGFSAAVCTIFG